MPGEGESDIIREKQEGFCAFGLCKMTYDFIDKKIQRGGDQRCCTGSSTIDRARFYTERQPAGLSHPLCGLVSGSWRPGADQSCSFAEKWGRLHVSFPAANTHS